MAQVTIRKLDISEPSREQGADSKSMQEEPTTAWLFQPTKCMLGCSRWRVLAPCSVGRRTKAPACRCQRGRGPHPEGNNFRAAWSQSTAGATRMYNTWRSNGVEKASAPRRSLSSCSSEASGSARLHRTLRRAMAAERKRMKKAGAAPRYTSYDFPIPAAAPGRPALRPPPRPWEQPRACRGEILGCVLGRLISMDKQQHVKNCAPVAHLHGAI
jgi:hypothetical protein